MVINFDSIANRAEIPTITLCNPNKSPLYDIDETIYDTSMKIKYNSLSEFTFTVPSVNDVGNVEWFDKVKSKRLIYIENFGYYMIFDVNDKSDGIVKTKEVTAYSLECELNFRKVSEISGTYKFYDVVNNKDTILGKILAKIPSWTIGYIDSALWNKYRTFEVTDQSVYNFLMTTVEQSYECIFTFDTEQKKINAYSTANAVYDTDITISFENLCKSLEVKEMQEEYVTALNCYGSGDLDIHLVNPLGTATIYNFNYYLYSQESWMTDSLKNALIAWNSKVTTQQPIYANLLTQYRTKNAELITLNSELTDLNSQLTSLEALSKIRVDAGEPIGELYGQIESKNLEIKNKATQITTAKNQLATISTNMTNINIMLSFANNFTSTQYVELQSYINESNYINEAFIQTDAMTAIEVQDMAQDLYNQSVTVLNKLAQMRYTFEMESVNFLFLQEFQSFTRELKLGSQIHVEHDDDTISYPVLLELDFSWDKPTDFSMTFGNRLRLDSESFIFSELFGDSVSTASTVASKNYTWGEFATSYKDEVSNFLNNNLDASKNAVINSTDVEIEISNVGLRGRKKLSDGTYDPHQLWITGSKFVMTDDNWRTAKLAIGLSDDGKSIVNADVIGGKLLLGNALTIANENNSFVSDALGTRLNNASFTVTTDSGKARIILDATNGIKVQGNTGSGFQDKFWADTNGNINFTGNLTGATGEFSGTLKASDFIGGTINIGNGTFTVDNLGNCVANSINIKNGKFSAGTIEGTTINGATINGGEINVDTDVTIGERLIIKGKENLAGILFKTKDGTHQYGFIEGLWNGLYLCAGTGIESGGDIILGGRVRVPLEFQCNGQSNFQSSMTVYGDIMCYGSVSGLMGKYITEWDVSIKYLTITDANSTYAKKPSFGEYAEQSWVTSQLSNYATQSWCESNFAEKPSWGSYATESWVEMNFVHK